MLVDRNPEALEKRRTFVGFLVRARLRSREAGFVMTVIKFPEGGLAPQRPRDAVPLHIQARMCNDKKLSFPPGYFWVSSNRPFFHP